MTVYIGQNVPQVPASLLPAITLESLGAKGDGIADDSAAFQAAANMTGVRITGANSNYLLTQQILVGGQRQIWDMRGCIITTTQTTNPIFHDESLTDGVTLKTGFCVLGGEWIGSGLTGLSSSRLGILLLQWSDVQIIGGIWHEFQYGAMEFRNCPRVWVIDNSIYNVCKPAGANAVNYRDWGPTPLLGGFIARGNIIGQRGGVANGGINIICTSGGTTTMNALIESNVISTLSFTGVGIELNTFSSGASKSVCGQVKIGRNIIYGTQQSGLFFQDDGANPWTADPYKMADITVENNWIKVTGASGYAGIHGALSRSEIRNNTIINSGTGRCIRLSTAAGDTTAYDDVLMEGNKLYQTGSPSENIIDNNTQTVTTNAQVKGGRWKGTLATTTVANWATISGVDLDTPATNFAATQPTAGTSPFVIGPFPYDCVYILQTPGGLTAHTYSRNSIGISGSQGSSLTIRRGETVTITWTTTAPTYRLIPLP